MSTDTPNRSRTATCENCGSFVTARYCRVMGDGNDNVHACPECSLEEDRFRGATGGADR